MDCDNCGREIDMEGEALCEECQESVRAWLDRQERDGRASMAADDECDRRAGR